MMAKYIEIACILLACSSFTAHGKRELVPTYFKRKYKNGSYVDATIKSNWFNITSHSGNTLLPDPSATLNVDPDIVKNGQYVKITWMGVKDATEADIIALYCPITSKDNDYYDFFYVDQSSTYKQGYGEYSVQLYNVRANCEMRYFRFVSIYHQDLVTRSNTILFKGGPEMPLQIHLALTGDPTQMRVMWVSGTGES